MSHTNPTRTPPNTAESRSNTSLACPCASTHRLAVEHQWRSTRGLYVQSRQRRGAMWRTVDHAVTFDRDRDEPSPASASSRYPTGTESVRGRTAQKLSTQAYQTTMPHRGEKRESATGEHPHTVPVGATATNDLARRQPRRYTVARMTLRSAAAHRNLLYLLSLKELRTRYKKSILGWAWSLLNPLTQMGDLHRHLPVHLQSRTRRSATRAG